MKRKRQKNQVVDCFKLQHFRECCAALLLQLPLAKPLRGIEFSCNWFL
jgi:hypothetical protein